MWPIKLGMFVQNKNKKYIISWYYYHLISHLYIPGVQRALNAPLKQENFSIEPATI